MAQIARARVFMSGSGQHVTIPVQYRLTTNEVYVRRDPETGDLILSQVPATWEEVYAALDNSAFPEDFLTDRTQGTHPVREEL